MQLHNKNRPPDLMRSSMWLFLFIFLVSGSLINGAMLLFYQSEIKTRLNNLKSQELFGIELQGQIIGDVFDSIVSDLLFTSKQNELADFLTGNSEDSLEKISTEYIDLARQKKLYDQIRFIDGTGMETVRINYMNGYPVQVTKDKLQSKRERYYFADTYQLEKGEVFISPFDLNIENGEIEKPLKPMIRLGTPVFDADGLYLVMKNGPLPTSIRKHGK